MGKISFVRKDKPIVWSHIEQRTKYSLLVCFIWISFVPVFADEAYTSRSSGNKTVVVSWTVNDTGPNHVLKCIADGIPVPTLSWIRDEDDNFTSASGIMVDVSKPEEISITFNPITYSIIGDYFCVSSIPGNDSFRNYTDFRVSVETSKSTGVVIGAIIILIVFMGAAFFVCKTLRTNDGAIRIDM